MRPAFDECVGGQYPPVRQGNQLDGQVIELDGCSRHLDIVFWVGLARLECVGAIAGSSRGPIVESMGSFRRFQGVAVGDSTRRVLRERRRARRGWPAWLRGRFGRL